MRKKIHIIPIIILVILIGAFIYASTYTLKSVEITGCNLSSQEQVKKAVKEKATKEVKPEKKAIKKNAKK